ncbi:hypothetical protein [Pseudomonas aeruginosa]|uniref:hypothetical protein n=1 Tax=Pseudomonas aeruginosa TaxID=287 RepID=UPI002E2E4AB7|nr:hypothetical protein [Pseudomonas aeruginosa]
MTLVVMAVELVVAMVAGLVAGLVAVQAVAVMAERAAAMAAPAGRRKRWNWRR